MGSPVAYVRAADGLIYSNPKIIGSGGFVEVVAHDGAPIALVAQWIFDGVEPSPVDQILGECFESPSALGQAIPLGPAQPVEVPTDPEPRRSFKAALWRIDSIGSRINPAAIHDGTTRWPGRCRGGPLVDPPF